MLRVVVEVKAAPPAGPAHKKLVAPVAVPVSVSALVTHNGLADKDAVTGVGGPMVNVFPAPAAYEATAGVEVVS